MPDISLPYIQGKGLKFCVIHDYILLKYLAKITIATFGEKIENLEHLL